MSRPPPAALDVYLLPAVVGGGLGDIEEVLAAGRQLARAGHPILLLRGTGRPMPRSVEGPWGWPPVRRVGRPARSAERALTLSAWWGVSAAPPVDAPFGRAGPWAPEAAEIERAYGPGRVLHVSFEEFARTLTSRQQTAERWREGGVPAREIRRRLRSPGVGREIAEFHDAYVRFRGFDRPDVLHLFPGFAPSRAFGREFPEAVQTGPFWPEPAPGRLRQRGRWIWYASPASSSRLAGRLAAEWDRQGRPITIEVRSPRRFELPDAPGLLWRWRPETAAGAWRRRWASAELRISTGSRTLLEAIADGGPFLYFNGVTGPDRAPRRHRPEKILELLRLWRRAGVPRALRRFLAEFSRLRSIGAVVRAARSDRGFAREFPGRLPLPGYRPPYDDAAALLGSVARRFASGSGEAAALVAEVRRAGRSWPRRPSPR